MVDKKKLNRVKRVLSAGNGAELPKYTVRDKDTLSQIVLDYNKLHKTNFTWQDVASWNGITDPNKIYPGQVLNFTNPQQNTAITGANQSEGNPDAALENAATVAAQAQTIIQGQQAGAQTDVNNEVVAGGSGGDGNTGGDGNGGSTGDGGGTSLNGSTVTSVGMTLTEDQKKDLKKQKILDTTNKVISGAFNAVGSVVGAKQAATDSNTTKTADALYDSAAGIAESFGPVGQAVGTIMKVAGTAGDMLQELGGGTDQQTKLDKWMDSSFFSWNIGMINGFAGKNSDSFGADQDALAAVGSSYGGTAADINDAASKAGKKYGLFSSGARKKANEAIAKARSQQNLMGSIADNATDQRLAVQSMGEQAGLAYSIMTDGGYNQKYTYAAKHGGMLEWNPVETLEWEPQIELNWELPTFKEGGNIEFIEELEWIPEFKIGGKTEESDIPKTEETSQKNVIPEGALHKNKHHMEHAEGLTKKGIPVIDGDGEQQAEIEHSEIIFTLEVTKKLEEYYEIFYSDESSNKEKEQAAIDAGKLLVFQILENTEDRTGLIESCKKGGSLTLKTTTDDLIEEVLEWMPTVVIVEEKEPEEKPKKKEEKSDKELMKEAIKEVLIELLTK